MFNQLKQLLSRIGQQQPAIPPKQQPPAAPPRQPDGIGGGNKRPRYKQVITGEQMKQFPPNTSMAEMFRILNPTPIPLEPHEQAEYVLPLMWSLSYALTKKQWSGVRERHKKLFPEWEKCDCPKRCKANSLDEHWDYDHTKHIKTFLGAKFICPGCHWLKSPGARILTWKKPMPPMTKPPHIIDCLGWTQARIDKLRADDLGENQRRQVSIAKLGQQVQQGKAVAMATPVEHLSTTELEKFLSSEQSMIAPWSVDLSRLSMYGYSIDEIQVFEKRMYDVAAKRMKTLG